MWGGLGARCCAVFVMALVAATGVLWSGRAAAMPAESDDPAPLLRAWHAAHVHRGDGNDAHHSAAADRRAAGERDLALAATWHLDPRLLRPLPTDSAATTAARLQLAEIDGRMREAMAAYDSADAAATQAADDARAARAALEQARAEARAAEAAYEADRSLLADVITEAYTENQMGPLALMLTADTDEDMVTGLTMMQEMSRTQTSAVEAADRSRDRLRRAQAAVAAADQVARDDLAEARSTLADATAKRDLVLADVTAARTLLEGAVLTDLAVRERTANGYDGALAFPLPAGTSFVDQHNWGRRSHHWASVHTGDDLSTACGTPVLAVNDGTVLIRTDQRWAGPWLVMVSAGDGGLTTWYAHMQALTVSDGQQVSAGQQIGYVGQQGNATGCHLHLEVHPTGGSIYQDDTDPSAWLDTVGVHPGDS